MAQIDVGKLHKIAAFSHEYLPLIEKEGLAFKKAGSSWTAVRGDWWPAFVFFLDQAYYTGRSDELSQTFEKAAVLALESVLIGRNSDERLKTLKEYRQWVQPSQLGNPNNPFEQALAGKYPTSTTKTSGTGRDRDRRMVLEALRFVMEECEFNIVESSVNAICAGQIARLYHRLDAIPGVGEKVAKLFLSTTVSCFGLDSCLQPSEYQYVIPIDRWVQRICAWLGMMADSREIARVCQDNGIPPIRFEQGMWYVGSHSFEALLRTLDGETTAPHLGR